MPNNITISCPECGQDVTFDNTWLAAPNENVANCTNCPWTCAVPVTEDLAPQPQSPYTPDIPWWDE